MNWQEQARFLYRAWRYRLSVEPGEIREVLQGVEPGQTVVDIGGHKGAFTYWLRKAVGPTGRVFTFEPQPELASYLRRIVAGFGYANVHIVEAALSERPGEAVLYRASAKASPGASLEADPESAGDRVTVTVDTLDRVLNRNGADSVDFIKCDAEGHELAVFRGAQRLLSATRPTLLFECEQRHNPGRSISEVFEFLDQLGYEGYYLQRRQRLPLTDEIRFEGTAPRDVINYLFQASARETSVARQQHRKSA